MGRPFPIPIAEEELAEGLTPEEGSSPPRPSLPPVLAVALGMWASCAVTFSSAEAWPQGTCVALCLAGAASAILAVAAAWVLRPVALWCALIGMALGACVGAAGAASQHSAATEAAGHAGQMRLEMTADGMSGPYGASCFARTVLPDGRALTVRLQLDEEAGVPRYGEVLEGLVTLSRPQGSTASYCWSNGAAATARVDHPERRERHDVMGVLLAIRERGIEAILDAGSDEAAVLAALVCGWRDGLEDDGSYGAFKVTGLAHLIAVSGAHLSIVTAFVGTLLRLARAPRSLTVVVQVVFILGYLVLSAAPASAVRAGVMAFVSMGSLVATRRPSALNALSVCVIAFVTLSPASSLSPSFALSALSTLGIVLFSSLASAWVAHAVPRLPRAMRDALSLTLASGVMATPLSAALFSQIPLVSPLANVVTAPLFPLVCAGGLVATLAAAAAPPMAFLVSAATACTAVLVRVVELVASIPHASVPADIPLGAALAVTGLASAAVWRAWPRPRIRLVLLVGAATACLVVCLVLVAPRLAGTEIVMLDIGQGDAIVIRSEGSVILVDTGNQDRLLREGLARQGIYRIDAIVITHGDDDHCGSLLSLKGVVQVDRVLVSDETFACGCPSCGALLQDARDLVGDAGLSGLRKGDGVTCGAFDLRVIWPARFSDEGGNADSLCLLADADVDGDGTGEWRALLVGDAERDQLARMIDEGVGPVDLYKVGHHGSKNALDAAEAERLTPSVALVSCGAENRYGHPAASTVETLEAVGARVYRTDVSGDVSCKLSREGVRVVTLR